MALVEIDRDASTPQSSETLKGGGEGWGGGGEKIGSDSRSALNNGEKEVALASLALTRLSRVSRVILSRRYRCLRQIRH